MILHTVLFQPKTDVSDESRRAFADALRRASTEIPVVRRARVGRLTDIGVSYQQPGDKAYEYVAVFEFDSVDDLRTYLYHPLHQELGRLFWLTCEATMIHDSTAVEVRSQRRCEGATRFPLTEDRAFEEKLPNDVPQRGNRLGGIDADPQL